MELSTAEAIDALPEANRAIREQPRISSQHLPALDGVRGMAILLVLGHHFRFLLEPAHRLERIGLYLLDGGWCGVDLFFVLSGFLITGILLDTKGSTKFFCTFYARRALRIFPLYYSYLVFVFCGLAFWWNLHFHFDPWKDVPVGWYLLYIENFKPHHMFNDLFLAHLWSLAIEEQFYLVWPLFVFILNRASLGFVCVTAMTAALICRLFLAGHGVQESFFLNTFTLASLDPLCAGALVALIVRSDRIRKRACGWIAAAALLSSLVFVLLAKSAGSLFLYAVPINTWGLACLSIIFACLVFWMANGSSGIVRQLFSFSPLREVGRVSYGMYVLHPVVIGFVLPRIRPFARATPSWEQLLGKLGVFALLTLVTYLAALLSWQVLERPFLQLKKRFQYSRRAVPTVRITT